MKTWSKNISFMKRFMTFRSNLDKNYINYENLVTDYMKKDISVAEQENMFELLMVYMNYFNNVYWYIDL